MTEKDKQDLDRALNVIDKVLADAVGTRSEHDLYRESFSLVVKTLRAALNPPPVGGNPNAERG